MINKKNKTYFFVVISFVCIAFIVGFHILDGRNITLFDPIIEYIKQYHIKDVVNIVAILSGISAILVGIASIRISNLGAVIYIRNLTKMYRLILMMRMPVIQFHFFTFGD